MHPLVGEPAPVLSAMLPDPLPPPSSSQMFVLVHPYRFEPVVTFSLKNASPATQVEGRALPVLKGFVDSASVKSTFFACVPKSKRVGCATTIPLNTNNSHRAIRPN